MTLTGFRYSVTLGQFDLAGVGRHRFSGPTTIQGGESWIGTLC